MKKEFLNPYNNDLAFSMYNSIKKKKFNRNKNHFHPDMEISFIFEGTGIYLLGEEEFFVQAKDIILVEPNKRHCIPTITSKDLKAFNIHISAAYLMELCTNYIPPDKLQTLINSKIRKKALFHSDSKLTHIFNDIRNLQTNASDENMYMIRFKLLQLLVTLSEIISIQDTPHANVTSAVMNNMKIVIDYINNNFSRQITLSDISKSTAMSQSYICTNFKLVFGVSPYEYILLERLNKAVNLIKNTDLSILQISLECGFNSVASFYKAFKKRLDMQPSSLRK